MPAVRALGDRRNPDLDGRGRGRTVGNAKLDVATTGKYDEGGEEEEEEESLLRPLSRKALSPGREGRGFRINLHCLPRRNTVCLERDALSEMRSVQLLS